MPRQIIIEFDYSSDSDERSLVHRVLNFNDSLLALARDDKWMSFTLDQIDKATGQRIDVKSARRLRRALARIEKLIEDHGLAGIARVTIVSPEH